MDMNELMKAAGQLQQQLKDAQSKAETLKVTGESGGGMVKVTLNGRYEVLEVSIDPTASGDRELLEDLLRAAFNQASAQVGEKLQGSLGSMAQGLGVDLSKLGF